MVGLHNGGTTQNKDPRKKIKYLGSDFDIEENGASYAALI